jgi:hypothetical protein
MRPLIAIIGTVACASGLWACGDGYVTGQATIPAITQPQTTANRAPAQSTDVGGREGTEAAKLTPTQQQAIRGAERAARRFLRGYLPYSYGRPNEMRAATPELLQVLKDQRPRVPADQQDAKPRLLSLRTLGVTGTGVLLRARVADPSRYVVDLTLVRRGDTWLVSEVR